MNWWTRTSSEKLEEAEDAMLEPLFGLQGLERRMVEIDDGVFINTLTIAHADPSAPVLVMAHGYGAGLALYSKNLAELSQTYTIHAFDWLGFGRSSRVAYRGKDTRDAEEWFLSAVDKWLDALGVDEPVHFLGHSMGGYLTAVYGMTRPQRVRNLILVSPVGVPHRPTGEQWRRIPLAARAIVKVGAVLGLSPMSIVRAAGPWGQGMIRRTRSHMSRKFADLYDDVDVVNEYSFHVSVQPGAGEFAVQHHILGEFAYAVDPLIDRLHEMRVPTTFMYGETDWMDRTAGGEAMKTMRAFTDLLVIPAAGHNMFADNAPTFNAQVVASIERMNAHEHVDA